MDEARQGIHISGFQFAEASIIQNFSRQFVLHGKLCQHIFIRGVARLGFLDGGQFQFLEQDLAKLLGRVDIELHPRLPINGFENRRELMIQFLAERFKRSRIQSEPIRLDFREHDGEGQLDPLEQFGLAARRQFVGQDRAEARDGIRRATGSGCAVISAAAAPWS